MVASPIQKPKKCPDVRSCCGEGSKDRLVPVHTTTQAALRSYVHERDAAFPMPKDQAFFLSSRGNRLSATGLQNGFAEARKLAGLDGGKPLRPHDLRHRFAVTRLGLWHQ
ncbi:tyrosine-type recombinase/integrase [Mesorhizobium sp. M0998]|uniref:tyrosine-type recombinase/integrase n=1 Tax=Mesorhizobium sp. M0998 TaxID=2957044 RepID=UPI003336F487